MKTTTKKTPTTTKSKNAAKPLVLVEAPKKSTTTKKTPVRKPKNAKPVVKPVVNDGKIHVSEIDKPCRVVWDIADANIGMKRKDVLELCRKAGIAFYTARTQYQLWSRTQKDMAANEKKGK